MDALSTETNENLLNELPEELRHPGGFVEKSMNYILESSVCPQPIFALSSSIALAGTLYGRWVKTSDGQYTIVYCMGVGYHSAGKDKPLTAIASILDSVGATHLRLGQVTSRSAIEGALKRNPRFCLLIDEAGDYFGNCTKSSAKGSYAGTVTPALKELWSRGGKCFQGQLFAPKDGKVIAPIEVHSPNVCIYAVTQPQILFNSLSVTDMQDGWLARNLFFISLKRPNYRDVDEIPVPNSLKAEVLGYKDDCTDPTVIPYEEDARALFREFSEDIRLKMGASDGMMVDASGLWGKAVENAKRIALILAVSKHGKDAHITIVEATYAIALVKYLVEEMVKVVQEYLAENQIEKDKKTILSIIKHTGHAGIIKKYITRRTQSLNKKQRNEYLEELEEADLIFHENIDERGGGTRYFSVEQKEYRKLLSDKLAGIQ